MTPFAYLLIGHLLGDFLFQTSWMAANKARHWGALLSHCTIYTLSIFLVSWWGDFTLSPVALTVIFLSHVLLDRRDFVQWWNRVIMRNTELSWLCIVTDQIFHICVLALILHYGL